MSDTIPPLTVEPAPVEAAKPAEPEVEMPTAGAIKYAHHNSEYRKIFNVLTVSSASLVRKPEFRSQKCVVFGAVDAYASKPGANFVKGPIMIGDDNPVRMWTYVKTISEATIYPISLVIEARAFISSSFYIAHLNGDFLAKEPKTRKYNISNYLNPTIIEFMQVAPLNPTLRAHLTAIFKCPPPPEADTFDKLRDWCEYEFEPPQFSTYMRQQYGPIDVARYPASVAARLENAARSAVRPAFHIEVDKKHIEVGSCSYKVPVKFRVSADISENVITQCVRDGVTVDEIVYHVRGLINDVGVPVGDEKEYGTPDCEDLIRDHVVSESIETSDDEIRKTVIDYLIRKYGKKEAQEIVDRG